MGTEEKYGFRDQKAAEAEANGTFEEVTTPLVD
ncbi:MAG: hypothetical protein RLZZ505_2371 [Verrucomicrobiota bacterium]|jgi:hypothetical protein